jgi:hypothetical protein
MMQAASDIYLGWTEGAQTNRWLYWRHAVRSGQLEGIEGV